MTQAFTRFKLKYDLRLKQAAYKQRNWDKVKTYACSYMREWRKRPASKLIVAKANFAYKQRNALAMQMYNTLRYLAEKDGLFVAGPAQHNRREWSIRR